MLFIGSGGSIPLQNNCPEKKKKSHLGCCYPYCLCLVLDVNTALEQTVMLGTESALIIFQTLKQKQ